MKEAIREMFLTDWVKEATTNEIVEKLIENDERAKEIERLNNTINELEKDLEEVFNKMKVKQVNIENRGYYYTDLIPIEDILNKLQELKGDSSNE